MIYSLLHLIAAKPQLLLDHAEGYSELIAAEASGATAWWKRRAVLYVSAIFSGTIALVLAGIAAMLWAALPAVGMQAPWVLILVPALPTLVAIWCAMILRTLY